MRVSIPSSSGHVFDHGHVGHASRPASLDRVLWRASRSPHELPGRSETEAPGVGPTMARPRRRFRRALPQAGAQGFQCGGCHVLAPLDGPVRHPGWQWRRWPPGTGRGLASLPAQGRRRGLERKDSTDSVWRARTARRDPGDRDLVHDLRRSPRSRPGERSRVRQVREAEAADPIGEDTAAAMYCR